MSPRYTALCLWTPGERMSERELAERLDRIIALLRIIAHQTDPETIRKANERPPAMPYRGLEQAVREGHNR